MSCLVFDLSSLQVFYSMSWQSVSCHIRELSSYHCLMLCYVYTEENCLFGPSVKYNLTYNSVN